jgi:hypothetical protein
MHMSGGTHRVVQRAELRDHAHDLHRAIRAGEAERARAVAERALHREPAARAPTREERAGEVDAQALLRRERG